MSKLLLDDKPLIVLPSLAAKLGLNESIILQQLHYWLLDSRNIHEGSRWVYNTYDDWAKQFPFWSVSTIRRTISKLEKEGLIIIGNFNKLKIDNTKWYRINYDLLEDMSRPPVQNEQTDCSEWTDDLSKVNRPLPESTSENTTKKDMYIEYAEFVKMKESEYQKLLDQFGESGTKDRIENLNLYKGSTGKKYKSDYLTILNWERKNSNKGAKKSESNKPDYSQYDFEKEREPNF